MSLVACWRRRRPDRSTNSGARAWICCRQRWRSPRTAAVMLRYCCSGCTQARGARPTALAKHVSRRMDRSAVRRQAGECGRQPARCLPRSRDRTAPGVLRFRATSCWRGSRWSSPMGDRPRRPSCGAPLTRSRVTRSRRRRCSGADFWRRGRRPCSGTTNAVWRSPHAQPKSLATVVRSRFWPPRTTHAARLPRSVATSRVPPWRSPRSMPSRRRPVRGSVPMPRSRLPGFAAERLPPPSCSMA